MAIRFLPSELLKKMAPVKKVERLVTQNLTVNKAAVRSLGRTGILSKKSLSEIALRVVKTYKKVFQEEQDAGATIAEAKELALNDKKLMVQRVQNAAVFELSKEVRSQYHGEYYVWLPSDADEADPLHQLNYGQTFQIGDGEAPGERFGCRCGMEILVNEDTLEL